MNEDNFKFVVNLKKLNLSKNRINTLNAATFLNLSQLTDLNLSENSIINLDEEPFFNLGQISN